MPAKIERLLDGRVGKVLAEEGNEFAPGHEARQLVLAGRTQAAEATVLDTADLGADGRYWVGVGSVAVTTPLGNKLWNKASACAVGAFCVRCLVLSVEGYRWQSTSRE